MIAPRNTGNQNEMVWRQKQSRRAADPTKVVADGQHTAREPAQRIKKNADEIADAVFAGDVAARSCITPSTRAAPSLPR